MKKRVDEEKEHVSERCISIMVNHCIIFRIKQVKHSLEQQYQVLSSQVKTGWTKFKKINRWFMKKMNLLKIELCKLIWIWGWGIQAVSRWNKKWDQWEDRLRNYLISLCDWFANNLNF